MKLIKTVSNLIEESRRLYDEACDKGVSEKELERLEKNYQESLRLMKIINKKQSQGQVFITNLKVLGDNEVTTILHSVGDELVLVNCNLISVSPALAAGDG